MVLPISVVVLILYYQCKFSGVPQSRYSVPKTRTLTATVLIWSVMRVLQCWNGLYASRQFLGMTLLLSGYSFEKDLFIPIALILQYLLLEIMPFIYVLDQQFLQKIAEKPMSTLTEPLFE